MRIHLEGDWSASWAFGLAAIPMMIAAYVGDTFSPMVRVSVWGLGLLYIVIAILLGVFAKRGREVSDGSTWVSWNNTGSDAWMTLGSAFFLYAAGFGTLMFVAVAALSSLHDWEMVGAVLGGLLAVGWGIVQLNFAARVVVFTPNKHIEVLKGRPCAFFRKTFLPKDWLGLHVSYQQGYSGGMYYTHPDNLYVVWGVYPGGAIQLNTVNIPTETKRSEGLRMIREMVEDTAKNTGLPVPPWPADSDIYLRLDE